MPAQSNIAGDRIVAPDLTVVAHMCVGHKPVVVADDRRLTLADGTMKRNTFTHDITVSERYKTPLTVILMILRGAADYRSRPDLALFADSAPGNDRYMRLKASALADAYVLMDDAIGSDHN